LTVGGGGCWTFTGGSGGSGGVGFSNVALPVAMVGSKTYNTLTVVLLFHGDLVACPATKSPHFTFYHVDVHIACTLHNKDVIIALCMVHVTFYCWY